MKIIKNLLIFSGIFFTITNISATSILHRNITIYNNIGLIEEEREINIKKGIRWYFIKNLPSTIRPESIWVKMPKKLILFEKEFISSTKVKRYNDFIGKNINIITKNGDKIKGVLIKFQDGSFYIKTFKNSLVIVPEQEISFIEMPFFEYKNSYPKLGLKISSNKKDKLILNTIYLVNNLFWNANYIGLINQKENKMEIQCWADLHNNTGASFTNVSLKLIAGDANILSLVPTRAYAPRMAMAKAEKYIYKAGTPQAKEKKFFDYHLYSFDFPITVQNRALKQILLFSPKKINVKKEYVYESEKNENVGIYIKFKNSKENNLGIPLPAGNIKIYQRKDKTETLFIGENMLKPTPKNGKVKLYIGKAFDIKGKTIIENFEESRKKRYYKKKIILENRKDKDVIVKVIKKFYGDWEIIKSTMKYKKIDAFTVEWQVKLNKNKVTSFVYEYYQYFK